MRGKEKPAQFFLLTSLGGQAATLFALFSELSLVYHGEVIVRQIEVLLWK
jgi:hypothetical protein